MINDNERKIYIYAFSSIFHASCLSYSQSGVDHFFTETLRKTENDPVVFATAAHTIIPLGNATGGSNGKVVCFHFNQVILI